MHSHDIEQPSRDSRGMMRPSDRRQGRCTIPLDSAYPSHHSPPPPLSPRPGFFTRVREDEERADESRKRRLIQSSDTRKAPGSETAASHAHSPPAGDKAVSAGGTQWKPFSVSKALLGTVLPMKDPGLNDFLKNNMARTISGRSQAAHKGTSNRPVPFDFKRGKEADDEAPEGGRGR